MGELLFLPAPAEGPRRPVLQPTQVLSATKQVVARYFRKDVRTIDRWVAQGMPFEYVEGRRRFSLPACEAWLESVGNGRHLPDR